MGWQYIEEPVDYYQINTIGEAKEIINRLMEKIHYIGGAVIPTGMDARTSAGWYLDIPGRPSLKHLIVEPSKQTNPFKPAPYTWTPSVNPVHKKHDGTTNIVPPDIMPQTIMINGKPATDEEKQIIADFEKKIVEAIFGEA